MLLRHVANSESEHLGTVRNKLEQVATIGTECVTKELRVPGISKSFDNSGSHVAPQQVCSKTGTRSGTPEHRGTYRNMLD